MINVLRRAQNFPVISSLKNVVILCGTNNLLQDSPEDIADGIIEIARTFQSKYHSINIATGGDASGSINRVLIKEFNEILKAKCSLYITTMIVVGLLQMVHLTQTSSFCIMCI